MQRLTIFTSFLLPWLTFCVISTFCEYPTRHHQDRKDQKLTQGLTMQRQKRFAALTYLYFEHKKVLRAIKYEYK